MERAVAAGAKVPIPVANQLWGDRIGWAMDLPWVFGEVPPPVEDYHWELYNVDQDFTEANDLAAKEPKKLRELQDLF